MTYMTFSQPSHGAVTTRHPALTIATFVTACLAMNGLIFAMGWQNQSASGRGILPPGDAAALAAFLPYVEALEFGDDAALHYAEICADLKTRGALIGANDLFIAAHARALGLVLVTNNVTKFRRVTDLKLENWTLPRPSRRR